MMAVRKTTESWSVVEAKAHLDEVIEKADDAGPQTLVKNTDELAVVVPPDEWSTGPQRKGTLLEFFQSSGLGDVELDITRHPDTVADLRDVDL
jgi:prevent-host-death family protein